MSSNNIKEHIQENNIKTIYLQFTDINGKLKSIQVPASKIDKVVNNEITIDSNSITGIYTQKTKTLKLHPDIETFLIFPPNLKQLSNTARFICDIYNLDNTPFEGCVRLNLKKLTKEAKTNNYNLQIGPEVEFFLFKTDKKNTIINTTENANDYYGTTTLQEIEDIISEISYTLENSDIKITGIHKETAPNQYEIDIKHNNILTIADNLITLKFLTKAIANERNYKVSFMPKPIYGQNGSGLHLNISLINNEELNLFNNPNKQFNLSTEAKYAIGGLLKNIKEISAILNPTVNSYKRLVKDYEAPIYLVWSAVTRSALIRIPAKKGTSTRLELRSPDCSTNPYLAFAVILQTCLDGIRNKIDPPTPIEKNLFLLSNNEIKKRKIKSLPRNMFTALEKFEKSYIAKVALGEYIFKIFLESKQKEWKEYRKQVTAWEIENYLDV